MIPQTPCPDAQQLQQFVLGRVPLEDLERLAAHVEHCSACVARLRVLTVSDPLPPLGHALPGNVLNLLKNQLEKSGAAQIVTAGTPEETRALSQSRCTE